MSLNGRPSTAWRLPRPSGIRFFDRAFCEASTLPDLLAATMSAACETMGADMGTLQLLDGGILRIVQQKGFRRPFLRFFEEVKDDTSSTCGVALREGRRILVQDVAQSAIFADTPALRVLQDAGVSAVQSVPLVGQTHQLIGVISVHYQAPTHGGSHPPLLDVIGRRAGKLIDWKARRHLADQPRTF